MMKADPDKVAEAIHEWIKEEFKANTTRYYELGKYFFSISTGTAAFIATGRTIFSDINLSAPLIVSSLILLGISLVISIFLMTPREWFINGEVELENEIIKLIKKFRKIVWFWFFIWALGLILGLMSLKDVLFTSNLPDLPPL